MRHALLAAMALVLTASAWGCGGESTPPDPAAEQSASTGPEAANGQVVVVRDAGHLPAGCDPASVADLVGEFATALNGADLERIQDLLAQPSHDPPMTVNVNEDGEYDFVWFVDSLETNAGKPMFYSAYGPAEIEPQVELRHAAHDTLRLLGVRVLGDEGAPNSVSGSVAFERTADDFGDYGYGDSAIAFGKYGMNCASRTIFLWSVGVDAQGGAPTLVPCKKPEGWTIAEERVLACS